MRYLLSILAALVLCAPAFGQVKQRAYYSNTINGQLVHVRAVNYGPIGNTIVVTNPPNAAVFESVAEWNASNPSNQVADVGSTTQQLGTNQYTFALSNGFLNTVKALSYITNTGEVIADTGTNALKFTNAASFDDEVNIEGTYFTDYQLDATDWNFILNWEENYLSKGGTIAFRWFHDGATGFFLELPLSFIGTNAALHAAQTRANLGLGATNDVTFRNVSVIENNIKLATTMEDEGATVLIKRGTNEDVPLLNLGFSNNTIQSFVPIDFNNNTTNAATTRTNLGLPLAALTNDSNVTLMRALSGSTNTNHPFSGSVSVVGTNNTNTLVFSNGILQSVQ
jgi:hypothetical protein